VTGATLDKQTGLYTITTDQYKNLESLFFQIGDSSFELTRNAQILPRILNTFYGGTPDRIYLVVGELGNIPGLNFICGMTFLQRFYSVYDTTNQRVGLAATPSTYADTN
jgi:cathepsin E